MGIGHIVDLSDWEIFLLQNMLWFRYFFHLNSEEDITLCFGGCAHCDCEINWPSVQSNPAHFSNGHNQRSRKVIAQQKWFLAPREITCPGYGVLPLSLLFGGLTLYRGIQNRLFFFDFWMILREERSIWWMLWGLIEGGFSNWLGIILGVSNGKSKRVCG